jgi:hypothetical protein
MVRLRGDSPHEPCSVSATVQRALQAVRERDVADDSSIHSYLVPTVFLRSRMAAMLGNGVTVSKLV